MQQSAPLKNVQMNRWVNPDTKMRHSQLHWKIYKMSCRKILFQNQSNCKIWHVAEEQLVYYGNQLKIQCLAVEKKPLHMWCDQSATTCYEGQHVAKLWKSLTGYGGVDALWVAVLGIPASRRSVIRASVDLQAGRSCASCYTLNLPLWHSLQRLGTMCTLYDAMHRPQFKCLCSVPSDELNPRRFLSERPFILDVPRPCSVWMSTTCLPSELLPAHPRN